MRLNHPACQRWARDIDAVAAQRPSGQTAAGATARELAARDAKAEAERKQSLADEKAKSVKPKI